MDKNLVMRELQKTFKEEEIEWRVGATNKEKSMGLALPYVTNKAIQNRLDEVFGVFGWKNEFKEWKGGSQLCGISIWDEDKHEWITKYDGADDTNMEATKGGLSDSMKRAAVQFGIGRYLYKLDPIWVPLKEGKYLEFIPKLPLWALPYEEQEIMESKLSVPPVEGGYISSENISDSNQSYSNGKGNNDIKNIDRKQPFRNEGNSLNTENKNSNNKESNERPKNLVSDKQINLFNIRAKNKSRKKVYEIIGKFGYTSIETIEKKNFNNILYYIDQLPVITKAMA